MPYKQEYNSTTVGAEIPKTPKSVMGSQGESANIPKSFFKPRPTGSHPFPESTPSRGPKKNTHKPFKS